MKIKPLIWTVPGRPESYYSVYGTVGDIHLFSIDISPHRKKRTLRGHLPGYLHPSLPGIEDESVDKLKRKAEVMFAEFIKRITEEK